MNVNKIDSDMRSVRGHCKGNNNSYKNPVLSGNQRLEQNREVVPHQNKIPKLNRFKKISVAARMRENRKRGQKKVEHREQARINAEKIVCLVI